LFGVTQRVPDAARFACGSFDHTFVVLRSTSAKTTNKKRGNTAVSELAEEVLKPQHANCVCPNTIKIHYLAAAGESLSSERPSMV
jgi:hypothetical protein